MPLLEGYKILIVDDDEDILASMELAMRVEGASTLTAADGTAAVAECVNGTPDVVILDMMLPKRSGFLVLEEILAQPDPPIIVMVTANEGKRHMAYATALGVQAYLIKPVGLDRLIKTVCSLLEDRDAKHE